MIKKYRVLKQYINNDWKGSGRSVNWGVASRVEIDEADAAPLIADGYLTDWPEEAPAQPQE